MIYGVYIVCIKYCMMIISLCFSKTDSKHMLITVFCNLFHVICHPCIIETEKSQPEGYNMSNCQNDVDSTVSILTVRVFSKKCNPKFSPVSNVQHPTFPIDLIAMLCCVVLSPREYNKYVQYLYITESACNVYIQIFTVAPIMSYYKQLSLIT